VPAPDNIGRVVHHGLLEYRSGAWKLLPGTTPEVRGEVERDERRDPEDKGWAALLKLAEETSTPWHRKGGDHREREAPGTRAMPALWFFATGATGGHPGKLHRLQLHGDA